ncbi:hypothetical protein KPH14_009127 [Odynerus spinipes]|uniref:Uncharacterized protein n=1 Tax=Odynerus spinipes TaxID=1348599 RepID=A0AAD9VR74_9HYME|nr:hypothetical protein KPH14_009127 [Odynerus spinipes]
MVDFDDESNEIRFVIEKRKEEIICSTGIPVNGVLSPREYMQSKLAHDLTSFPGITGKSKTTFHYHGEERRGLLFANLPDFSSPVFCFIVHART